MAAPGGAQAAAQSSFHPLFPLLEFTRMFRRQHTSCKWRHARARGKKVRRCAYVHKLSLCLEMSSSLSNYALRMARLSARIFGEVARPTDSSSMKVVKLMSEQPYAKRKEVYDWYPPHNTYHGLMKKLRFYGLYRDEHEDFKDEMKRLKKLRGKGPPKKGEGKRALKKK